MLQLLSVSVIFLPFSNSEEAKHCNAGSEVKPSILVSVIIEPHRTRPVFIHHPLFMPPSPCDISNNSINWLSSSLDRSVRLQEMETCN